MVETLLVITLSTGLLFLGVYAIAGVTLGSLSNLSPKFHQYVDTLMGTCGEKRHNHVTKRT